MKVHIYFVTEQSLKPHSHQERWRNLPLSSRLLSKLQVHLLLYYCKAAEAQGCQGLMLQSSQGPMETGRQVGPCATQGCQHIGIAFMESEACHHSWEVSQKEGEIDGNDRWPEGVLIQ